MFSKVTKRMANRQKLFSTIKLYQQNFLAHEKYLPRPDENFWCRKKKHPVEFG